MKLNETHFLVGAFMLHLTLPVAAYISPDAPISGLALSRPVQAQEFDIEVDNLPPSPRITDDSFPLPDDSEAQPEDGDAEAMATRPGPRAPLLPPDAAATANPKDEPVDPNATLNAAEGADTDGHSVPSEYGSAPSAADIDGPGGPGSGPLWARPGMVPGEPDNNRPGAPTRAPARRNDPHAGTKALKSAMRKKDSKLGLDLPAASAIAGVIRGAVRGSDTPYECTASFTVTLSGSGNVTAVSLNSYSGGSPGVWQGVRKNVLAQLKGTNYPMKSAYEKGAIIGYSVNSAKKSPGGGTGRDGLTLKFDVADIGARATRVVKVGWSARPAG